MKIDRDFIFYTGVSKDRYGSKKEVVASLTAKDSAAAGVDKMSFCNGFPLTADMFAAKAAEGYCFCNLFSYDPDKKYRLTVNTPYGVKYSDVYPEYKRGSNKGYMRINFKSGDFFMGSYCVFIDIDETVSQDMESFISSLEYKPTVAYYTYSDTMEKRKFRMLYVFDSMLGEEDFYRVSKAVHDKIEKDSGEMIKDKCGTRESQYFNGTDSCTAPYISYTVYNAGDFNTSGIADKKCKVKKSVTPTVNPNLVSDMERLDYDEFMHTHSKKFRYWYRVEKNEWIEGKFQYIDDDYFSLYWNASRLKDGMCRRRKLFQRMCLRRVIFPDATPDEILFNAYVDLAKFIDNSEDPVTIDDLARNVNCCFRYTVDELAEKFRDIIDSARKSTKPKNGKIYRNRADIKDANRFEIGMFYVPGLSVKENKEILEENGVNISLTTLYAYANENGICTKRHSDEEILSMLDRSKSLRANQKALKEKGIEISHCKIAKLLKNNGV